MVNEAEEFAEQDRIAKERPSPIVLFVRRAYRTRFLFVEPEYPETEESER